MSRIICRCIGIGSLVVHSFLNFDYIIKKFVKKISSVWIIEGLCFKVLNFKNALFVKIIFIMYKIQIYNVNYYNKFLL
jgi:hypothetical protein